MHQRFSRKAKKRGQYEAVEEQYKKLRHHMLASDAWRALSGSAIKVYLEICRRFNGRNNGQIHLSQADAAKLLFLSKSTVKRSLDALCKMGFIKYATKGSFYGRRAATFVLTEKATKVTTQRMSGFSGASQRIGATEVEKFNSRF